MKTHPVMGANILKGSSVAFIQMGARVAECHHERWDGSGYPFGLRGEQIPLEARIIGLVDVYDALSSRRVYKRPWAEPDVLGYIEEQSGKHFDPALAALFLRHYEAFREIFRTHPDTFAPEELP
jgi:putative two-component system response regulator